MLYEVVLQDNKKNSSKDTKQNGSLSISKVTDMNLALTELSKARQLADGATILQTIDGPKLLIYGPRLTLEGHVTYSDSNNLYHMV